MTGDPLYPDNRKLSEGGSYLTENAVRIGIGGRTSSLYMCGGKSKMAAWPVVYGGRAFCNRR